MLRYPILCQISLPLQPGSVVVERFCHHSVASPQLGAGILVILPVQIYFVSNFVAVATEVGRARIYLTSFNSWPRKHPYRPRISAILFIQAEL